MSGSNTERRDTRRRARACFGAARPSDSTFDTRPPTDNLRPAPRRRRSALCPMSSRRNSFRSRTPTERCTKNSPRREILQGRVFLRGPSHRHRRCNSHAPCQHTLRYLCRWSRAPVCEAPTRDTATRWCRAVARVWKIEHHDPATAFDQLRREHGRLQPQSALHPLDTIQPPSNHARARRDTYDREAPGPSAAVGTHGAHAFILAACYPRTFFF